jgi:ubiquinone/menaquinone biosynthesis C-methylase UbiE
MREKTAKGILKGVKKTYSIIAEDFSKTRRRDWAEFKEILPHINPGNKVADIGCGNGRFFAFLNKKLKTKYTGIDNSTPLLQEARRLHKAKFIKGDLLKLPLKPETQDAVVCIASLHHIPSPTLRKKAILELARITRPKGKLCLTVWNLLPQERYKKQVVKALLKWLYTLGKYERRGLFIPWGSERLPRYYYAFKDKELENLLNPHFKIIKKAKGKNLLYICEKK